MPSYLLLSMIFLAMFIFHVALILVLSSLMAVPLNASTRQAPVVATHFLALFVFQAMFIMPPPLISKQIACMSALRFVVLRLTYIMSV